MFKAYSATGRCWKSSVNKDWLLAKALYHFEDVGVFYFVDTDSEQYCKYILYRKPRSMRWRIVERGFLRPEFPFR